MYTLHIITRGRTGYFIRQCRPVIEPNKQLSGLCPTIFAFVSNMVDIFIDDPQDLSKTDNVRALVQAKNINYIIGIREDIQETIKQFFEGKPEAEEAMGDEAGGDYDMIPDIEFEEEMEEDEEDDELDESSSQVVRMVDQVLISA